MAASREQSQFSRKRSNTAQSSFKALPTISPLNLGDTKILHAWVHDVKESHCVIFNHSWWTGVQEGDCLKVSSNDSEDAEFGFLFTIPKLELCPKPQLQVCMKVLCVGEVWLIAQSIDISSAPHCGCLWSTEQRRGHDNESKLVSLLRNNLISVQVDKSSCSADHVEFVFQDLYLGRNEMWRLGKYLSGQCIYKDQEISFIGGIVARISKIFVRGKGVCLHATLVQSDFVSYSQVDRFLQLI